MCVCRAKQAFLRCKGEAKPDASPETVDPQLDQGMIAAVRLNATISIVVKRLSRQDRYTEGGTAHKLIDRRARATKVFGTSD